MTKNKLFENILRVTEQFMRGRTFKEHTASQLMKKLGFPKQHRETFKEVLSELVKSGVAVKKGHRYRRKETAEDVVAGVIRMHHRGFGFVQTDETTDFTQDIFIPRHLTMNAVDGDHVEVLVNPKVVSAKGPEGRITAILERARKHLAGIVRDVHWRGDVYAYAPLLGEDQRILVEKSEEFDLKVGDRIVMEVLEWGSESSETTCRISHYIGHISDPSVDIAAAIEEFEIRSDFPKLVVEEASKFGSIIPRSEIAKREDLRDLECVTIDPDTAKDFDDAISIEEDKKGQYHLGVHIADVSHFVTPGSALDEEAKLRANSTYFPGNCVPMLPKELSDNLCSLKPNVNRLTVSVLMTFDKEGSLINHRLVRSVIKSKKRFTYKDALAVLEGKKKSPHEKKLKQMVELCGLLKQKRYERGSIEFAIPEIVVRVDEEGVPQDTEQVFYDITHQMIEEFMLKANEVVATHLTGLGKELAFRVHEEPSEDNMESFAMLCRSFGFALPENPSAKDFQEMFDEALQTSYGQYLAQAYIRSMRLAIYSPHNIGHFGLSLGHYCHFTSPIRRYVDLVVHRILLDAPMETQELQKIADHCSEQERISAKAEQSVLLLKKLRLLKSIHESDPQKQLEAVITRVKHFGIYFDILDLMVEGFLHVSDLGDDYYVFQDEENRLVGEKTGNGFFAGEKITVMIKDINLIMLETSWHIVSDKPPKRKHRGRRRRR